MRSFILNLFTLGKLDVNSLNFKEESISVFFNLLEQQVDNELMGSQETFCYRLQVLIFSEGGDFETEPSKLEMNIVVGDEDFFKAITLPEEFRLDQKDFYPVEIENSIEDIRSLVRLNLKERGNIFFSNFAFYKALKSTRPILINDLERSETPLSLPYLVESHIERNICTEIKTIRLTHVQTEDLAYLYQKYMRGVKHDSYLIFEDFDRASRDIQSQVMSFILADFSPASKNPTIVLSTKENDLMDKALLSRLFVLSY